MNRGNKYNGGHYQNDHKHPTSSCHALASNWEDGTSWPISGNTMDNVVFRSQVPPSTKSKIADIMDLVCNPACNENGGKAIIPLLDDCCVNCHINTIVSYANSFGYNLLQMFSAYGLYNLVEHTLELGYDVFLLNQQCSSPLHLACKNGHADIVDLFVRHGANMNLVSTTCFLTVKDHNTQSLHSASCICKKHSLISLALSSDDVQMIRTLMDKGRAKYLDTHMALYDACQCEAIRCLEFMIPLLPEQANQRYGFQNSLSLFSIAFAKSVTCGCVLLESNISWKHDIILHVNGIQESLLHLVLQYPNMPNFFPMVRISLEKHLLKTHINALDLNGNSPLLVLLKMIGKQVTLQHKLCEEHVSEMFDILKYLVQQGADIHVRNKTGKSVLHVLLHDDIEYYPAIHIQSLPEIIRVIKYLLQFNIDINSHSSQAIHPLIWAVKILGSFNIYDLDTAWEPFANLVRLLLDHGADPNVQIEQGPHIINIILTTILHWLKQCVPDANLDCSFCMLYHVFSLIQELFQHGMILSADVLETCMKQIAILCNVNIPLKAQIQSDMLMKHIGTLLTLFFTHGIDPHQLEMVTKPEVDAAPCQLHALFYLVNAFIIHIHTGAMFHILYVFESCLDQLHFNNLITSLCTVLANNFNQDRDIHHCIEYIREKTTNSRSLQALCRVSINKQLGWKLHKKVPLLRLPKTLSNYLLFDCKQ